MDGETISKQGSILNAFMTAIEAGMIVASDGTDILMQKHDINVRTKAFTKAIKEAHPDEKEKGIKLNEENCAIYTTKGVGYNAFIKELWENQKIPCVAFTNTENSTVVIYVPSQYQAAADKVVQRLNEKMGKTELSTKQFALENKDKIGIYSGLSAEQVFVLRENLRGSGIGFCVQETMNKGEYQVMYPMAERDAAREGIIKALERTTGVNGEREVKRAEEIIKTVNTLSDSSADPSKTIYLTDAGQKNGTLYRCDAKGLYQITEAGAKLIVGRNSPKFESTLRGRASSMKAPIVKVFEEAKKKEERAEIYTRAEIKAAKEGMAISDAGGGKIAQAEEIATQILNLCVSTTGINNPEVAHALNSSVSMAAVVANGLSEENYRMGAEELLDRYNKLNLSPEEDAEVVKLISSIYGDMGDHVQEYTEEEEHEEPEEESEHEEEQEYEEEEEIGDDEEEDRGTGDDEE